MKATTENHFLTCLYPNVILQFALIGVIDFNMKVAIVKRKNCFKKVQICTVFTFRRLPWCL